MNKVPTANGKLDIIAYVARHKGNKLFYETEYHLALFAYNQALCLAEPGSLEMAYGYANRSACYTECQLYELALQNIDKALENSYPDLNKLKARAEKCRRLMTAPDRYINFDHSEFFRLSRARNLRIPFIVDCLELRQTKDMGRGIFSTESFETGEIVAIEEPLIHFINPLAYFMRCSYCMKSMKLNLFPCHDCPLVMFCSEGCKENDTYHHIPCSRGSSCFVSNCVLRLKHKALQIAGSTQQMIDIITKGRKSNKTVFNYDLSVQRDSEYKKKLLRAVSMLSEARSGAAKSLKEFTRAELLEGMSASSFEEEELLLKAIGKIFNIYSTNSFTLYENSKTTNFLTEVVVGAGLFPFLSLLNHSCDPNMSVITFDNKSVLISKRPIKAGEQLFVSYGPVSRIESKDARTEKLANFNFECKCIACKLNFKALSDLEETDRLFQKPFMSVFSTRKAIEQYRLNCQYIDNNYVEPNELNYVEPPYEVEFLIKHNEHLLFGIAHHIFKANGKEKNVFCDLIYNLYDKNQTLYETVGALLMLRERKF